MATSKDLIAEQPRLRIAILGAGISGSAAAFFLREQFGDQVDIDVFDKADRVGGRLCRLTFNKRQYELGGSVLHSSNRYMKRFTQICGLRAKDRAAQSAECFAMFDKDGLLMQSSPGTFWGQFKFAHYFGPFQLIRLKRWVQAFADEFAKIYALQDRGFTFSTFDEFLDAMPGLRERSRHSLRTTLDAAHFDERARQLASVACLTNYGQSIDELDAFVGLVSLAGCVGDLWSVHDGNDQVCSRLLELSSARVRLDARVTLVAKSAAHPDAKNMIAYSHKRTSADSRTVRESASASTSDSDYDYVLVAMPLFAGVVGVSHNELRLELAGAARTDNFAAYQMQRTNTYFVYGKLCRPRLPADKRVQLHSVEPSAAAYRTVCVNLPCDYSATRDAHLYADDSGQVNGGGSKLFKLFAEQELAGHDLARLFEPGYQLVAAMPWLAYPKYRNCQSQKSMPDVLLDEPERSRVLYLNALEWSASCMEVCCVAARNAVNLIVAKERAAGRRFDVDRQRRRYAAERRSKTLLGLSSSNSGLVLIVVAVLVLLGALLLRLFGFL